MRKTCCVRSWNGAGRRNVVDSAAAALQALVEDRPDVIVSDIGLPGGEDGYSLVRRIWRFPPEHGGRIPAVALTAYASREDEARPRRRVPGLSASRLSPPTWSRWWLRLAGRATPD
jgi:CheY-like chemotaxis protein